MGNKLALAALLLAGLALLLQAVGGGDGRGTNAGAAREVDLGPLLARIEALESENERLRGVLDERREAPLAVPEREPVSGGDPRFEELERRVAGLERRPLAGGPEELDALLEPQRAELVLRSESRESLQRAIDRAHDLAAKEEERLAALRVLRGQRDADGVDARLYVLDSMLELARTSTRGETRADVWRQLSNVTDARLRQPLLDALAFDEHAKSREEAAETLADFLPDLGIEAALRTAMEHDPDAGVRRQAAESLAGR